jgi:hypothetical protein
VQGRHLPLSIHIGAREKLSHRSIGDSIGGSHIDLLDELLVVGWRVTLWSAPPDLLIHSTFFESLTERLALITRLLTNKLFPEQFNHCCRRQHSLLDS